MSQKLPVVVLSTSDIADRPDRLTKAVKAGYVIHVASTRELLEPSDDGWRAIVEECGGMIFLSSIIQNRQESYSSGWRACLAALGHEWPTEEGEAVHWTRVQRMIDAGGFPGLISLGEIDKM